MSNVPTPDLNPIRTTLQRLAELSRPGMHAHRTRVLDTIHDACDAVQRALRQCGKSQEAATIVYAASDSLDRLAAEALARSADEHLTAIEQAKGNASTADDIEDVRRTIGTLDRYNLPGINGVHVDALRARYHALLAARDNGSGNGTIIPASSTA
ncbi:MAG: hypothetical protein PHW10_04430 [Candidatus Peribacteraceae bacterium]|nr:hypothetical protein [Candidatus Peribacteraceae bacterium]